MRSGTLKEAEAPGGEAVIGSGWMEIQSGRKGRVRLKYHEEGWMSLFSSWWFCPFSNHLESLQRRQSPPSFPPQMDGR